MIRRFRPRSRRPLLGLVLAVGFIVAGGVSARGATLASAACPTSNPPNTLTLLAGTPQTAKLRTAFADNLQVALANTNGCPLTTAVAGIAITFTAPASGASGSFAASGTNTVTVGTNASGMASAPMFSANDLSGSYTITAGSDYGSVSFSLTNTAAGLAASIIALTPTSQTATSGSTYSQPLQVQVLDANGNPVSGTDVTFSLGAGGSTANGAGAGSAGASFDGGGTQANELTNSSGYASSPLFSANSVAGPFTATAATSGITEPASFSLDNLAARPPTVTATGIARRSATVNTRYNEPLQVKVLDASGKPVQGASVTFTLGSSGGGSGAAGGAASAGASFVGGSAQATETTDAAGIATSPRFEANATAGRFTATAALAGVTNPASFALDNLAGKAPVIRPLGSADPSTTVGAYYHRALEVKVLVANDRPLQGATVTFTLGSSSGGSSASGGAASAGASFVGGSAQATETTDASGIATSPRFEANTTAGKLTATASIAGSTRPASFTLRNEAGRPVTITPGVAATESTAIGARFPVRLAVTVTDAHTNPVPGALVTFSAPARGPSGTFAHSHSHTRTVKVKTNASGVAVAPIFRANHMQGGYIVKATVRHATPVAAFALVNQPPGQP